MIIIAIVWLILREEGVCCGVGLGGGMKLVDGLYEAGSVSP